MARKNNGVIINPKTQQPYLSKNGKPWVVPHRRLLRRVRQVVRANRAKVLLTLGTIVLVILFVIAYLYEYVGNFTINLNKINLYRKGITLSSSETLSDPTSYIKAPQISRATNMALSEIPTDINEKDGNNSQINYLAYTFYLHNGGDEDTDFYLCITADAYTRGAEEAIWIGLYCDDEPVVYYAKANSETGEAEPGTVAWESDYVVVQRYYETFAVGETHKYTVVIFINGNDPDCKEDIVNGMARFSMGFDTLETTKDRPSILDVFGLK